MKKFLKVKLLAFAYVIAYIVALFFTTRHSVWGNLILAGLDLAGIIVAGVVTYRAVNFYHWYTWQTAGPVLARVGIVFASMTIIHAVGGLLFTWSPDLQILCAFGPISVLAVIGFFLWVERHKWPQA